MIQVSCPSCGKIRTVPHDAAGKIWKCSCGERVRIPGIVSTAEALKSAPGVARKADPLAAPSPVVNPPLRALHSVPSLSPRSTSAAKWVLLIALGVVLGLFLWTGVNAILAEWHRAREERRIEEARQSSRERERIFEETTIEPIKIWTDIMLKAQYDSKEPTLKARFERLPEYQNRLMKIGPDRMRREEWDALQKHLEISMNLEREWNRRSQSYQLSDDARKWRWLLIDRLGEMKKEVPGQ
jgi:hypothetical protein